MFDNIIQVQPAFQISNMSVSDTHIWYFTRAGCLLGYHHTTEDAFYPIDREVLPSSSSVSYPGRQNTFGWYYQTWVWGDQSWEEYDRLGAEGMNMTADGIHGKNMIPNHRKNVIPEGGRLLSSMVPIGRTWSPGLLGRMWSSLESRGRIWSRGSHSSHYITRSYNTKLQNVSSWNLYPWPHLKSTSISRYVSIVSYIYH